MTDSTSTDNASKKASVAGDVTLPAGDKAASSPAASTGKSGHQPAGGRSLGSMFLILMTVVVSVAALASSYLTWQSFSGLRAAVGQRMQSAEAEVTPLRELSSETAGRLNALQSRLSGAEQRISELNLQRTQLEELMLSVSRSRDETLVQDLGSALRFAVQQAQLMGNPQPLIAALQVGIERIEAAANPRLAGVRDAMKNDLDVMQTETNTDVSLVVRDLARLTRDVNKIAMRDTAPPTDRTVTSDADTSAAPSPAIGLATDPASTTVAPSLLDQAVTSVSSVWHSLSQAFVAQASQLVRVRAVAPTDELMLSPENAWVLRENLKLRLLSARLAVLSGQKQTALADISAVLQGIALYADPAAPSVVGLVGDLQQLQTTIAALHVPIPQSTLAALASAASAR
ncbi:MAG: uroporphyrinogen-III C-methyltransferase [Burkholderiaceae bacterium]|jgi:uroporphyrin-III C-methyltransferase|nr:uroporphyrinogen-III C-methyltransferase [Burkholderiaceae bacterium]MDO7595934.1 uroporphyrinogen-III C-methyltransferase [Burkholderiaceae bacterium]MDO7605829.1 uroporphyrinogen-III C-methyltransferase [Burkholderiaceae bacterium]MDO7668893.1 uroporphyrinogen-III C-methyltransferase [Burkholderiaceae bacterium]MDO7670369.1 uroporphyrinogen-III C-methyltransferase [Burkholderiaceae bacterium]